MTGAGGPLAVLAGAQEHRKDLAGDRDGHRAASAGGVEFDGGTGSGWHVPTLAPAAPFLQVTAAHWKEARR